MRTSNDSSWPEINLATIKNNIRALQSLTKLPSMAIVKEIAYGHGIVEIARSAIEAGSAGIKQ